MKNETGFQKQSTVAFLLNYLPFPILQQGGGHGEKWLIFLVWLTDAKGI